LHCGVSFAALQKKLSVRRSFLVTLKTLHDLIKTSVGNDADRRNSPEDAGTQ
jgi:hypothetical protein